MFVLCEQVYPAEIPSLQYVILFLFKFYSGTGVPEYVQEKSGLCSIVHRDQ